MNTFVKTPDTELPLNEFVEIFSNAYFLPSENDTTTKIDNISYQQTSKYVENIVMNADITRYADFAKIMAWKMGRIKQKDSETNQCITYYKGWEKCESQNPVLYNQPFDMGKLHNEIVHLDLFNKSKR